MGDDLYVYKDSYGGLVHFLVWIRFNEQGLSLYQPFDDVSAFFLSIVYIRSSPATNVTTVHIHTMQGIETSGFLPH